jgi:peroxiredoxin
MIFIYISGNKESIRIQWNPVANYPYALAGNKESKDLQKIAAFMEGRKRFRNKLDSLAANGNASQAWLDSLQDINKKETLQYIRNIADSLPNADVAAFALNYMGVNKEEIVYLVNTTARLHEKDPRARYAKIWYDAMDGYRQSALSEVKNGLETGVKAPDFTLPDIYGSSLSLSQFKGQYVLLDFWASWCQACRKENPNLVEAYRRFRKRNFTIVSISLDSKLEQWQKGVKADKLVWRTHASDLNKWRSPVLELFNIKAIPANYLIDTSGLIIAKNLYSEALLSYLDSMLPQPVVPVLTADTVKKDTQKAQIVPVPKPAVVNPPVSTPKPLTPPVTNPAEPETSPPALNPQPEEESSTGDPF